MRKTRLCAAALLVAGCASEPEPVAVVEAPPLTRDDCYTVVLFDDVEIEPPADEVPEHVRAFQGHWTNGAWNGEWCHDLMVHAVHPDGSAELFEMHAPKEDWGQPASAFRRTARIDADGNLRLRYGTENISYRVVDGALHARRQGQFGDLRAVLVNADAVARDAAGVPLHLTQGGPAPTLGEMAAAPAEADDQQKTSRSRLFGLLD